MNESNSIYSDDYLQNGDETHLLFMLSGCVVYLVALIPSYCIGEEEDEDKENKHKSGLMRNHLNSFHFG